uniref:Protein kinase domain-containing protein n=1 Tax=Arcella intermedia TaxID=1963864 RepID=A0A6B2L6J4_9EUKA
MEALGAGYFGEVRLGYWLTVPVACKILFNKCFQNKSEFQLFVREVKVLSELRHPNVIYYFGVCMHPRGKIIVTEFMENGSLYNLLRNSGINTAERISIAQDIALGVKYLHSQNILHRDLTSKNILLNNAMVAKVADFGLSKQKITGEDVSFTMGSIPWMAPEVLVSANNFNEKSDVYSYGIILWETFSRSSPCPMNLAHHHFAVKVCDEHYRPPLPELPEKWSFLIQKCWHHLPEERPPIYVILELLVQIKNEYELQQIQQLARKVERKMQKDMELPKRTTSTGVTPRKHHKKVRSSSTTPRLSRKTHKKSSSTTNSPKLNRSHANSSSSSRLKKSGNTTTRNPLPRQENTLQPSSMSPRLHRKSNSHPEFSLNLLVNSQPHIT